MVSRGRQTVVDRHALSRAEGAILRHDRVTATIGQDEVRGPHEVPQRMGRVAHFGERRRRIDVPEDADRARAGAAEEFGGQEVVVDAHAARLHDHIGRLRLRDRSRDARICRLVNDDARP